MGYTPYLKVERGYLDKSVSPVYSESAVPASAVSPELTILHKRHFSSAHCTLGVSM